MVFEPTIQSKFGVNRATIFGTKPFFASQRSEGQLPERASIREASHRPHLHVLIQVSGSGDCGSAAGEISSRDSASSSPKRGAWPANLAIALSTILGSKLATPIGTGTPERAPLGARTVSATQPHRPRIISKHTGQ